MGLFGSKKKQVIGYKYSLGIHMIAGHGNMDACEKIKVGEKIAWEESNILKESFIDGISPANVYPHIWFAQTFTASSNYSLTSVACPLYRAPTQNPGIVTVNIYAVDGSGHPTGDVLCYGTTDGDTLPTSYGSRVWREFVLNTPVILVSGTKYAIVMYPTESEANDAVTWSGDIDNYAGGNAEESLDHGRTWTASVSPSDLGFKTYEKNGSAPNKTITINKPNLFGGERKEGGIVGDIDLMFGDPTQLQNDYLKARLDSDIPAYRGLWSAILKRVYIGMSGYLKPWSFYLKRCCKQISGDDQWYIEKAVIRPREEAGDDLNAIHIIRECLIDSEWGMGELVSNINDNSFKEAANILYDEGFGLTMLWSSETSVEEFIGEVLTYIAGMLYQDLETGEWNISLTRDPDYDNPYDYYNTDDNNVGARTTSVQRFAQTFIASKNYSCNKIKIKVYESAGAAVSDIKIEIQTVDSDGHPDGNILASGVISGNDVSTEAAWVECNLTSNANLIVNTKYALVAYPLGIKTFYWRVNTFSPFLDGTYEASSDSGATWSNTQTRWTNDFMFEIYAGGDLETFNEADIIKIEDFDRPSYGEIIDKVVVKWWDKLAHKVRSASARDIALIEKQGGAIIEKVLNYQGICNPTLANTVVERELNLAASMLASMKIICTRKMAHLKPNDTFILSWPDLDITSMAIRILNANYGNLHKNEVVFDCVEDVFSTVETVYGDSADTLWTDPITDPVDVVNRKIIEIPYYSLCKDLLGSVSLVDALDNDAGFISVLAEPPSDDSFDYDLLARLSASYDFDDVGQGNAVFTPTGIITDDLLMNADDVVIDLSSETNLDLVEVNSLAIINNEMLKILAIDTTNNQIQIARGILDTVPAAHSSGDRIYFIEASYTEVDIEYTATNTPQVKLLSRTANGSLEETDATIETASALDSRAYRPYPPGNLKFNGDRYPTYFSSTISGKVAITWTHRNRTHITQLNSLVKQTDATDFGREGGTATYTVKVYDEDNNLVRTASGLTGSSYDYTEAFERNDCGLGAEDPLNETLRFVIYTVRDGYDSFQSHDVTIERSLIGSVEATSDLSGWLVPNLDGRRTILPESSITGALGKEIGLAGSVTETSGVSGFLNSQLGLAGAIVEASSITGSLSEPV